MANRCVIPDVVLIESFIDILVLELITATRLIQLHVQNLIGGACLASNNFQLLPVIVDFGHDIAHLISKVVELPTQAEVSRLLPALS